jgi:hypothetical protein
MKKTDEPFKTGACVVRHMRSRRHSSALTRINPIHSFDNRERIPT